MIKIFIIELINSFWEIFSAFSTGVYKELHNGHLVRRTILGVAAYLQVYSLFWCFEYAMTSTNDATAISLVIGAIMAPVSTLFGAAIKFYNEGRKNQKEEE